MIEIIKPINKGRMKITKPAEAMKELQGMKVPEPIQEEEPSVVPKPVEYPKPKLQNISSSGLTFGPVNCIGADGKIFDSYLSVEIQSDVHINFGKFTDSIHQMDDGKHQFIPSFALTCNLLAVLYECKDSYERAKDLLVLYREFEDFDGRHLQNTIIDWSEKKIIHYPREMDIGEEYNNPSLNSRRNRTESGFEIDDFNVSDLEKALEIPEYNEFLRNLTGLPNPEILLKISAYFSMEPVLEAVNMQQSPLSPSATWIGGFSDLQEGPYISDRFEIGCDHDRSRIYSCRKVISKG